MKQISIYTDGSCSGNPGPGGYAAILLFGEHKKIVKGHEANTTNNRMELMGPIEALKALKESCEVTIYSDSAYVVNAYLQNWVGKWKSNGWRSTTGSVKNKELWVELDALISKHKVKWIKVKGHADDDINNECDIIAKSETAIALSELNTGSEVF